MILGVCSIVLGGNDEVGTDQAMFIKGVAIVLVANVAIAVRNCASKKYTEASGHKLTYPEVCTYSLLFVSGPFLFKLPSLQQSDTLSLYYLLTASVFHVMYSGMSFYVLSFVEPSSHSIIKLLSRSVIVTSLTVIFGMKEFSIQLAIGIMFCIIGALL